MRHSSSCTTPYAGFHYSSTECNKVYITEMWYANMYVFSVVVRPWRPWECLYRAAASNSHATKFSPCCKYCWVVTEWSGSRLGNSSSIITPSHGSLFCVIGPFAREIHSLVFREFLSQRASNMAFMWRHCDSISSYICYRVLFLQVSFALFICDVCFTSN